MLTREVIDRNRVRIIGPRFLPETKTHPTFGDRRYQFESPHGEYLGYVTIQQGKKSESYFFDEDVEWLASPGRYGRSFLFGRITGKVTDEASGFYRVTIPPGDKAGGCECKGFGTQKVCKHVHTVLDLLSIADGPLAKRAGAETDGRDPRPDGRQGGEGNDGRGSGSGDGRRGATVQGRGVWEGDQPAYRDDW